MTATPTRHGLAAGGDRHATIRPDAPVPTSRPRSRLGYGCGKGRHIPSTCPIGDLWERPSHAALRAHHETGPRTSTARQGKFRVVDGEGLEPPTPAM